MFGWIGMSSARSGVLNAFVRFGKSALVRVRVRNVWVFGVQQTPAQYKTLLLLF